MAIASGLSYSILRPTVLFGREDILVNNIAWALRRFPVFGVFGDGAYRLQPIFVDDLAELAVREGHSVENRIIDAIGHKLGLGEDKVFINVDRYGNTGSATVPLGLWEAHEQGRIQPGDLVLLTAFGAGFHWASAAMQF